MPSSRVRVLNLLDGLKEHDIESEVIKYPSGFLDKIRLFKRCKEFDAVYLQKRLLAPVDVLLLRCNSAFLVFDFDDAIYCRHESTQIDKNANRYQKFKSIDSRADLIIAGNNVLKKVASEFNDNIEIIPSAVFVKDIPKKNYSFQSEKLIIGWVGSSVNLSYLKLLAPVLRRLTKKYPIQLRIICDVRLDIDGVDVKFIPWSIDTQDMEIAKFDIGIMPLADSLYASGKCGYKALQYMAAAVPAVVSDVGVNIDIVQHGSLGEVAKTVDDFYPALEKLLLSAADRKLKGEASRLEVIENYSIKAVSCSLATILKKNLTYI